MRALVIERPLAAGIREVADPIPGAGEVLIRVKATGICGTDVHQYIGDLRGVVYPLIPGHELAGEVVAVGSQVTRFRVGDRVTADPILACERCYFCQRNQQNFCENWGGLGWSRPGAMAEFLAVPEGNVYAIPDRLTFAEAAFAEPLACVAYGLERARMPLGSSVLIFGAGPIGQLHVQTLRHGGAGQIAVVDPRRDRLEAAEGFGANHVVTPGTDGGAAELLRVEPRGFDLVIDCTGVPRVVEGAIRYVKNGGKLLVFGVCPSDSGITVNPYEVYRRDLEILGSFALRKNIDQGLQLLVSGAVKVRPMISDRLGLEELVSGGLERVKRGEARGKIQLSAE